MYADGNIWIAQGDSRQYLYLDMANRHGLITGASGTGKTVTLRVLAESLSDAGVPVFLADIKGDLGGLTMKGDDTEKMRARIQKFGIQNFEFKPFPTRFWDVYGDNGTPIRATVSAMGPALLTRLLGLSDVQGDVLNVIFRIAKDKCWEIIDINDLSELLKYINDHKAEYAPKYGNMATTSIGAVQRAVRALEDNGGDVFFGEPELDISDWMKCDADGRGFVNVLNAQKLASNPSLYGTFMMWLMSQLFEVLPEAGDLPRPKLVFFFDEAHMLFSDASKALVQKIEQMVKLIRSKGVGIYFVTQSPSDIPDPVLAQLSNRIQHALRAYTPADQKAVKAAATAFRSNPKFKTEDAISDLGVGEALVSCLDESGRPTVVERAFILPPQSKLGAIDSSAYAHFVHESPYEKKYRQKVERDTAFEKLIAAEKDEKEQADADKKKAAEKKTAEKKTTAKKSSTKKSTAEKATERAVVGAATSFTRSLGTALAKSLFKKK
jgi:DNA helicase HerA-like ATPase